MESLMGFTHDIPKEESQVYHKQAKILSLIIRMERI